MVRPRALATRATWASAVLVAASAATAASGAELDAEGTASKRWQALGLAYVSTIHGGLGAHYGFGRGPWSIDLDAAGWRDRNIEPTPGPWKYTYVLSAVGAGRPGLPVKLGPVTPYLMGGAGYSLVSYDDPAHGQNSYGAFVLEAGGGIEWSARPGLRAGLEVAWKFVDPKFGLEGGGSDDPSSYFWILARVRH
jgi:opacity protein-like surface antigen